MRKVLLAVIAAFALGSVSSVSLAHCSYHEKAAKKNDVETPPPAGQTSGTQKKG